MCQSGESGVARAGGAGDTGGSEGAGGMGGAGWAGHSDATGGTGATGSTCGLVRATTCGRRHVRTPLRLTGVPYVEPELQAVATAVAHPVRRFLLELLVVPDATATDLAASASDVWGISIPRASQHLQVLARAELVDVLPDGPFRYYRRNPRSGRPLGEWLRAVELEG